jgi:hypothetical protein
MEAVFSFENFCINRQDNRGGLNPINYCSKYLQAYVSLNYINSDRSVVVSMLRSNDQKIIDYRWVRGFLFLHSVHNISGAQPSSYPVGTESFFPQIQNYLGVRLTTKFI